MQPEDLKDGLIVSCQPVPGGPQDNAATVIAFARAALDGGAVGLRIESLAYLKAVRPLIAAPIVGIIKEDRADTPVRITPTVEQVIALCEAGADIIAFDATRRSRPAPVTDLIAAIRAHGRLAMADCSDVEDARAALAAGADFVGSTLSGYTGGPEPELPNFDLIEQMRRLTPHVIAEGRIRSPEQAAEAIRRGAFAVTIGSALTRTEHATAWFKSAIDGAAADTVRGPVLAIDIGGTKTLAGLVEGDCVEAEIAVPTTRDAGPDSWLEAVARQVSAWKGRYAAIAAAVTGFVSDGCWSAMNPATLGIPDGYPLLDRLGTIFGAPAFAANDAQAAAWGEYRFGAGQGRNLVFLTVSTGVGGGVVINGRPLLGIAGHFGLLRAPSSDHASPWENEISGRWIAAEAQRMGKSADAAGVFAAAAQGEGWAEAIVSTTVDRIALLCSDIQLTFDPECIVIGGGIGLAEGFLSRLELRLQDIRPRLRPDIVPARLGSKAGLIGVADLASNKRANLKGW